MWNMKVTVTPVVICALGTVTKRLAKGNKTANRNYPKNSIIEIGQNTEKRNGDLRTSCYLKSYERPSANTEVPVV